MNTETLIRYAAAAIELGSSDAARGSYGRPEEAVVRAVCGPRYIGPAVRQLVYQNYLMTLAVSGVVERSEEGANSV